MIGMRTRRTLMWVGVAIGVLVVLRFAVRWADATGRLPPPGELGIAVLTLVLLAAVVGVFVLVRRGQTRKNR
jgi:hypothetical protein